jgi:predicted unusual protein kinase regulating ubiquinone biosynthesis (AarF/ABC1/UbiB family)
MSLTLSTVAQNPVALAVLAALGAALIVLLVSRTARRMLRTGLVATRAIGAGIVAKLTGKRDPGPVILRRSFEDLGPTYIKLGQLVASSQGLFPERYCVEFRKCLDRVRPFGYAEVEEILRAELGRDPREIFASIDEKPLASASIAQVHSARLQDGKDVVIKVQRPKIHELVEADLRVLHFMARMMLLMPLGELANPQGVVEDFESNIREELDFRREAANMAEFNRIMREHGQSLVAAPTAVMELTTPRVLVMERFFGFRVDDVAKLRESNFDGEEKLLVGMRAWFQCMILHGFFHGDVHAGNLMALSDGRIGFLDFGIVGRFPRERREQITDYLMAFATGDFRKLADVMVAMGSAGEKVNLDALARDLGAAYRPMLENDASAVKYADIIPSTMRAAVRHGLRLPRDFVLVVKQMLYFDRYAKVLAPSLNVFRDPRIMAALTMDMMQAKMQMQSQPPSETAAS